MSSSSQVTEPVGNKRGFAATAKGLATTTVGLASFGLALACALAFIPIWPCVLFEHFRVQYVVLGIGVATAAIALRQLRYVDIALVTMLVNALSIVPDLGASAQPTPANGARVRILVLNVLTANKSSDAVKRLIEDENPDVIGLVEVNQRWLDDLAPVLQTYGGRIAEPRPDNFGIALFVRGQISGAAEELGSDVPTIVATVELAGVAPVTIIVTHPIPPISGRALAQQEAQLDAVATRARTLTGTVIVMGDLNATPWSRPFDAFRHGSGLCDTRAGFGMQATFPASGWFLRIPIDHVLVSCSVGVHQRRVGRDVGSDHLPVIVDLVIPP